MSAHPPAVRVLEPRAEHCPTLALPPEGNNKLLNYRLLNETVRVYTPTGDARPDRLVPRYQCGRASPPRARILELVRPDDEGGAALADIVRATPRRLARPLDDDTRRFLQRALRPPSPPPAEPEPAERSLADELREAEAGGGAAAVRAEGGRRGGAAERERLGRLALAVEEDDEEAGGLGAAARRLDLLLAESRALHRELHAIHRDLQAQSIRADRCAVAARALTAESRALRYLDDVVALLKGDVKAASRVRAWPFAIGNRQPGRNYVV